MNSLPAQTLANIPGVLGYYPHQSIIFVTFRHHRDDTHSRWALGPTLRIDIDSLALGKRTALRTRLTFTDGTTHHDIHLPDQVVSAITAIVDELRGPQVRAEPAAGAWTREQIWMETFDFKLVTFYEWNHDPGFTDTDCADELRLHPRDAEHTPTWLAQGAERARTTPPPHPDENEGVYQAITEQERDARRNS